MMVYFDAKLKILYGHGAYIEKKLQNAFSVSGKRRNMHVTLMLENDLLLN